MVTLTSIMTERDIHKCILSYGVLAMTAVINTLERFERYEECNVLKLALQSFFAQFPNLGYTQVTKYTKQLEDEYYKNLGELTKTDCSITRENLYYYIEEIFLKLDL